MILSPRHSSLNLIAGGAPRGRPCSSAAGAQARDLLKKAGDTAYVEDKLRSLAATASPARDPHPRLDPPFLISHGPPSAAPFATARSVGRRSCQPPGSAAFPVFLQPSAARRPLVPLTGGCSFVLFLLLATYKRAFLQPTASLVSR